MELTFKIGY